MIERSKMGTVISDRDQLLAALRTARTYANKTGMLMLCAYLGGAIAALEVGLEEE